MNRRLLLAMLICGVSVLSSCTTVSPWERGYLSRPEMQLDPDPMETALKEHIYFAKEATSSGSSVSGGGCGCN